MTECLVLPKIWHYFILHNYFCNMFFDLRKLQVIKLCWINPQWLLGRGAGWTCFKVRSKNKKIEKNLFYIFDIWDLETSWRLVFLPQKVQNSKVTVEILGKTFQNKYIGLCFKVFKMKVNCFTFLSKSLNVFWT